MSTLEDCGAPLGFLSCGAACAITRTSFCLMHTIEHSRKSSSANQWSTISSARLQRFSAREGIMSLLRRERVQIPAPPLPRELPAPTGAPMRQPVRQYAEEAARAAQHVVDLEDENKELKTASDEWRNRALLDEGEIKRLEKRVDELTRQLEQRTAELTAEREAQNKPVTKATTLYDAASKLLLKG